MVLFLLSSPCDLFTAATLFQMLDAISCTLGQIKSFFFVGKVTISTPNTAKDASPSGRSASGCEYWKVTVTVGESALLWIETVVQLLNEASFPQKSVSSLLTSCCSLCLCCQVSLAAALGNRRVGYIRRTAGVHLFVTSRGRQLVDNLQHILWEWRCSSARPDSCKYCRA